MEMRAPTLGNEDADVLLSKPANREQLEIARHLARRDCVLVQGPPGTGKTHTIANLLGHLLAQGKRVLVTAHTPKALRILRDKSPSHFNRSVSASFRTIRKVTRNSSKPCVKFISGFRRMTAAWSRMQPGCVTNALPC